MEHLKSLSTVCFADLGKLNYTMVVQLKHVPILATTPDTSKNEAHLKSVRNQLKIIGSLTII
jgi:hypothetical protein